MSIGDRGTTGPLLRELIKQLVIVGFMVGLTVWSHEFILRVANTDLPVFLLLAGTGLFGVYTTLSSTYVLRNDFIGFEYIKELHADLEREENAPQDHQSVLKERMRLPQVVYSRPGSLGQSHALITDELLKNGRLQIPTQTMQVLLADAADKLEGKLGLNMYLGAIMVLLGLLGTFIGLMHTLESVGDILANMNLDNADGDAIGRLIQSLKGPLSGMAIGFGASLFGLVGSLLIGVLGRFQKRASDVVLHDFEAWILGAVQIEAARGAGDAAAPGGAGMQGLRRHDVQAFRALLQVSKVTLVSMTRLSTNVGKMAAGIDSFAGSIQTTNESMEKWFARLAWLLQRDRSAQNELQEAMLGLRTAMQDATNRHDASLREMMRQIGQGVTDNRKFQSGLAEDVKAMSDLVLWYREATRGISEELARRDIAVTQVAVTPDEPPADPLTDDALMIEAELDQMISDYGADPRLEGDEDPRSDTVGGKK